MKTFKKLSFREKIRNLLKNEWGTSTCYRCGGAWNWKTPYEVRVDENGGFFICCVECWNKMSWTEKWDAVQDMFSINENKGIENEYEYHEYIDALIND